MRKVETEKQSYHDTVEKEDTEDLLNKEKLKSKYSDKTDRELLETILSILEIQWTADLE